VDWLNAQDSRAAQRFWTRYLTETPLPTTSDRTEDVQLDCEVRVLSRDATSAVEQGARQCRVRLSTVVFAAWSLVDPRRTDDGCSISALTASMRPEAVPGSEHIAGLCINTAPFVVRAAAAESVVEWLRRLQAEQHEWYRH